LDNKKLGDLIIQVTGAEASSSVVRHTLATLKVLKSFADFNAPKPAESPIISTEVSPRLAHTTHVPGKERLGLNLSYTINLNLPATSDQAVFNAIFRSLKEHLLTDDE
jgi:hypothetical protein